MRVNQHIISNNRIYFRKTRKQIEILFFQLFDELMIHRNYAKSFNGLK
jgi:hypothetical protein